MIALNFTGETEEILQGLQLLQKDLDYLMSPDGIQVSVSKGKNIFVSYDGKQAKIIYEKKIHFFRALGILIENLKSGKIFEKQETPYFDCNGAMFDMSRNAVFKKETFFYILRKMAVMGLNMAMLYTEDTYEVPGYPYFGYMRGRFTEEELRGFDDYADQFGIELIPCIQTLGHLTNALKWPAMSKLKDTPDILLCDDDETYHFIEAMITAASKPYRSKRIHIGMDEAGSLGLGKYLRLHGYQDGFSIINRHLNRVMEITKRHGLTPMIWSDMFFRLASKSGNYYDLENSIPQETLDAIPSGLDFVYWDYYHTDEETYHTYIHKHQQFRNKIIFAGGLWTWLSPVMHNGEAFHNSIPALKQCRECGIREVFTTLWGDNGTESNILAALLGLQLYAEYGYQDNVNEDLVYQRFHACVGEDPEAFLTISKLDVWNPDSESRLPTYEESNFSKYLLYQDALLGLFDDDMKEMDCHSHYQELVPVLEKYAASMNDERFQLLMKTTALLADFLSVKGDLGKQIYCAYHNGDKARLSEIVRETIPSALEKLQKYRVSHKKLWHSTYKPFGYEVLDIRLAGVQARLESAAERISGYLDGQLQQLEELEQERLPLIRHIDKDGKVSIDSYNGWQRIATACPV